MKWLLLPLFLCGCTMNQGLLATSTALLATDWMQTRYIATHGREYYETNPVMGRHPSIGAANTYFATVIASNVAIYLILPDKLKPYWTGGMSIVEAGQIIKNASIGVGLR